MEDTVEKKSYVLQGWPTQEVPTEPSHQAEGPARVPALVPLPFSDKVREWCQAGKKVRVTFEVVKE